jgi:NAD(P)-dependent dehydrogenase (short-subunit alcohol dehydrogenase family)
VDRAWSGYSGQLDVLYLNVGDCAQGDRRAHATDCDAWQYLLDVNLSSAFYPCRAEIPAMLGRGGSIVVVSASEYTLPPETPRGRRPDRLGRVKGRPQSRFAYNGASTYNEASTYLQ